MAGFFASFRTLTYIGEDEVEGRGLERLGAPVSRILYYRAESPRGVRFFTF